MEHRGHLIVSGRWDDNVAIVDIDAALEPSNHGTANAVVSRPRVTPDVVRGREGSPVKASGQPVSVAVDRPGRYAYVVNHSGPATPEEAGAYQHGHLGLVTVMDLERARGADPRRNAGHGRELHPHATSGTGRMRDHAG